jgi:hypothetical protein
MNFLYSPYIIPVVAMLIPIVAIIGGIWGQAQARRVKADQRMAMLARGMGIEEIERVIGATREDERISTTKDPLRSLGNARRAGIILCSVGIGLILFFIILTAILHVRQVLAGAAAGVIPLAIGIGFFIDYYLQKRELSRFGMEIDQPAAR